MSVNPSILANRHFPGSDASEHQPAAFTARPLLPTTTAPPLYLVELHHRAQWGQLWRQLLTYNHLRLLGPVTATNPMPTLVFSTSQSSRPPFIIALATELVDIDDQGFLVCAPRPPLSWRLAAVHLAKSLPPAPQKNSCDAREPQLSAPLPPDRPLYLRWDLPGPASSITLDPRFAQIITALRAGFPTPRQLSLVTELSSTELSDFLLSLARANLLHQAPTLLGNTPNPFHFMGLHWSADQKLIRQRYQMLQLALGSPRARFRTVDRLDQAYELLASPADRAALRRAILPPAVIPEVIDYLQQRLVIAKIQRDSPQVIALCRTILELRRTPDPTRINLLPDFPNPSPPPP